MIREASFDRVFVAMNYLFLTFLLVIVLYPLLFIVSASLSNPDAVTTGRVWLWPVDFTLSGYERVLQSGDIWMGYRNTILYTVFGTILNLLITIPGAYALSRRDMAGRNVLTFLVVFTMFFSGGIIPTYLLIKGLGLLNTPLALIIPQAASVMNIVVTRTYFQHSIPKELEEAAEVDGCSTFKLFFQIVLPLSKPIIVVMALFYGVSHWNQYFQALLYLSERTLFPLQLILREILVMNVINLDMVVSEDEMLAMLEQARTAELIKYVVIIISSLPLLVLYPFMQRYFIQGVLIGSLKG
jgi:putative aldouronate transport system permease protein